MKIYELHKALRRIFFYSSSKPNYSYCISDIVPRLLPFLLPQGNISANTTLLKYIFLWKNSFRSKSSTTNKSSISLNKRWKSWSNFQGKNSCFHACCRAIKVNEWICPCFIGIFILITILIAIIMISAWIVESSLRSIWSLFLVDPSYLFRLLAWFPLICLLIIVQVS